MGTPIIRRTPGERLAYQDGYIAGLRLSLDQAQRRLEAALQMRAVIEDAISDKDESSAVR